VLLLLLLLAASAGGVQLHAGRQTQPHVNGGAENARLENHAGLENARMDWLRKDAQA